MVHIYDNNLKFLMTLNYNYEDFIKEPAKYYPEWQPSFYATQEKYEHPIFDAESQSLREMSKYEKFKAGLYELSYNEVEFKGDILTLEAGQYIKDNELITVPKIEGVRVEWNWELNKWEDVATELEVAELQYAEYDALDKPSVIDEMNLVDPTLGEELKGMLIELRGIISTLKEQQSMARVGYSSIHIPEPSKKLEDFKNKFNKFKK